MDLNDSTIVGRKTFFVAPDLTLLPETYMEEYMTHGYEAYIVNDDRYCPMDRKVEQIISMFPRSIFFFYVDAKIEGIEWQKFIYRMQREHGDNALFGVLYAKSRSDEERKKMEKFYLFDVGIQCGCIGLEFQQKKNFPLIDSVMKANQAQGRRKAIRAICSGASEVSFAKDGKYFRGKICDISLNHFSCMFDDGELPLYTKIQGMMLVIDGVHIQTNGMLLIQRELGEEGRLNVFVFNKNDGSLGLDGDNFIKVSGKIYQIISTRTETMLQRMFVTAGKELEESKAAEKLKQQAIQSAKDRAEKIAKNEQVVAEG